MPGRIAGTAQGFGPVPCKCPGSLSGQAERRRLSGLGQSSPNVWAGAPAPSVTGKRGGPERRDCRLRAAVGWARCRLALARSTGRNSCGSSFPVLPLSGSENKDVCKPAFGGDTQWALSRPWWSVCGPEAVLRPRGAPCCLGAWAGGCRGGAALSEKEARLCSGVFSYCRGPFFRSVGSSYSEPMLVLVVCNQRCRVSPRALADTRQTGKLSKDQFALAMYFIQQKVSKGIDPPQVLSPDMVPPSERGTPIPVSSVGPFIPIHSPSVRGAPLSPPPGGAGSPPSRRVLAVCPAFAGARGVCLDCPDGFQVGGWR